MITYILLLDFNNVKKMVPIAIIFPNVSCQYIKKIVKANKSKSNWKNNKFFEIYDILKDNKFSDTLGIEINIVKLL